MPKFRVPAVKGDCVSHDHELRVHFYKPLIKQPPPRCRPKGYIRVLELYGNENKFLSDCKGTGRHFKKWRDENPERYQELRRYAKDEGYDPDHGKVQDGWYYTGSDCVEGNRERSEHETLTVLASPVKSPRTGQDGQKRHFGDARGRFEANEGRRMASATQTSSDHGASHSLLKEANAENLISRFMFRPENDRDCGYRIYGFARNLHECLVQINNGTRTIDDPEIQAMIATGADDGCLKSFGEHLSQMEGKRKWQSDLSSDNGSQADGSLHDEPGISDLFNDTSSYYRFVVNQYHNRPRNLNDDAPEGGDSRTPRTTVAAPGRNLDRLIRESQPVSLSPYIVKRWTEPGGSSSMTPVFVLYVGNEAMAFFSERVALIWGNWVAHMQEESGTRLSLSVLMKLGGIPSRFKATADVSISVLSSNDSVALAKEAQKAKCFASIEAAKEMTTQIQEHFVQVGFENAEPFSCLLPSGEPGNIVVDTRRTDAWATRAGHLDAIKPVEKTSRNKAGIPVLDDRDLYKSAYCAAFEQERDSSEDASGAMSSSDDEPSAHRRRMRLRLRGGKKLDDE